MSSRKIAIAGAAAMATCALFGIRAGADIPPLTEITGYDPLPSAASPNHCASAAGVGANDRHNWEQEPTLAANPANPAQLATAWIQDWSDGIGVGYSTNAGQSWAEVVPPTSSCTPAGNPSYSTGAIDPWVAWAAPTATAPNGIIYLTAQVAGPTQQAEVVNRSLDGGRTWAQPGVPAPTVLDTAPAPLYIDGSYVVADPLRPNYAYALWRKGDGAFATRTEWMAYTTNGGLSWSSPEQVPSTNLLFIGHLVILPDGSLLAVSSEIPDQPLTPAETCATGPTTILARRSTDLGAHWLAPVQIPEPDPDNALTWSAAAVAPDGTVYVAWQHTYAGPDGPRLQIRYSQSADNGATWTSRPGIVADEPGGPELGSTSLTTTGARCSSIWAAPSVAVTPDGTLGIGYFDHRNDRPIHEPGSVTDYWLSYSHDRGATWATQHVAGPFDQTQAPSEDGATAGDRTNGPGFLGDYQGITALKGGFGVSLALAQPLFGAAFSLKYPPTDIFYGFAPVDT